MLLSLSVRNFKNIKNARVRFGPFTCFLGRNGVGKSNMFDAIHFLSQLADRDVSEAAVEVRRASSGGHSPLDLVFERNAGHLIELSADMIVPTEVEDDFGQTTKPSTTLLTYKVHLRYDQDSDRLLVEYESLTHAKLGDFRQFVGFDTAPGFQRSVAKGSRRGGPLISTKDTRIMLHGDGGSRGRPAPVGRSPLTVVGGTNTSDYPTVLAAKREMSSWRVLHLEPSSMRSPDPRWTQPQHVSASGSRIPATLHSLMLHNPNTESEIVSRLQQLNSDIKQLDVYVDEPGDKLALRAKVSGLDKWLYARSLSDGTLRYIALALMLVDVRDRAVLCIEEPENGIHPSRIPELVDLLQDYAVDPHEVVDSDNPLRQIIINSHSPEVARQLSFADIVFVQRAIVHGMAPVSVFRPVKGTWRTNARYDGIGTLPSISRHAVADFIGGSPVRGETGQLSLVFGTAR